MRQTKRIIAIWTLCLLAFLWLPQSVSAEAECSLTLQCTYENAPVSQAEFWIYRIGRMGPNGWVYLEDDFVRYPVTTERASLPVFAETIYGYACKDSLEPLHRIKTNEQGFAQVSGLAQGVYLVAGQLHTQGEQIFEFQPQIISLPYENAPEGVSGEAVILQVKCAVREKETQKASLKVQKVWEDGNNTQMRPDTVTVYLLKDGVLWDTVTLNRGNSWKYVWQDLDPNAQWQVAEEPVMDYFVSVSRTESTFIITNYYDGPIEPPDQPDIPQTGMLLWPIPVLAALGLGLIFVGFVLRRRDRE